MEMDDVSVKSVYNEGVLQIQRLNNSWSKCNYYSVKGLYKEWRWELDVIWRELTFDVINIDNKEDFKDYENSKIVKEVEEIDKEIGWGFASGVKTKIYGSLGKKEKFLRILQHRVGKGGKYSDEFEDGIDE